MKRAVSSYFEDNAGMVRSDDDDLGLPESPIYSNFSKHLWTTHTRLGQAPHLSKLRGATSRPRPLPVAPSVASNPECLAEEDK
jgi:hypothetical protein